MPAFFTRLLGIANRLVPGVIALPLLTWWISASRASLAQLFFSTSAAIAMFTASCVLVRLALGAAARYKAIGSICHIAWAPVATDVILWISLRILVHYAHNRKLRLASRALLSVAFSQLFPGIGEYMNRIAHADAFHPIPITVPEREFAAPLVAAIT